MNSRRINRRCFLRGVGLGAAGLVASSLGAAGASAAGLPDSGKILEQASRRLRTEPFVPDAEVSITAVQKTVQVLPGAQTAVYSYEGQLLSGSG
jgi:hypothetical protein